MLAKIDFPYKDMTLTQLFEHERLNSDSETFFKSEVDLVYPGGLTFPEKNSDYPYTYNSVVTSIDGRIAFNDIPEGPYISSKNHKDPLGGLTDFWILNLLRASADGLMFGANTLAAEAESTGHIYDEILSQAREKSGQSKVPVNVIPSLDCLDIPFDHKTFTCGQIPVIIYTTPKGLENCEQNLDQPFEILDCRHDLSELTKFVDPYRTDRLLILVTDKQGYPDNKQGLKALKKMGVNRLLIESPTLTHILLQEQLMDELFVNHSGLYLGGDALTIGSGSSSFTSETKPHMELLSLHMHSPYFMYKRYQVHYSSV